MPTWPGTLPQKPDADGYTESPPDVVLRTPMDAGPPKVRRRSTAGPRPITMQMTLTLTEMQTLDDFFWTTCRAGALPFDWVHPRTQAAATFRWRSPPRYQGSDSDEGWLAELELEIVP